VKIEEIKTVFFIGAGTMGCFNSLLAGMAGYEALVWDISAEALSQVPARQRELGARIVEAGLFSQTEIDEGMARVSVTGDSKQAAAKADLLSESVFECLDLKRRVHKQFDEWCPAHTIMTTNTSTLPVSEIESAVSRGDRFAALHFHLLSPLVDIMGGPRTAPKTLAILHRYVRSLGGVSLQLKKEKPGYLFNSVFGALLGTAMMLVIEGRATIQEVDRAWMLGTNSPAGPFGMMDYIGLNVVMDGATEHLRDPARREGSQKVIHFLQPLVARGELGAKTGKGFYGYPDPAFLRADFKDAKESGGELYDILFAALAATAILLVSDGFSHVHEVDRAWMAARRIEVGLFGELDQRGIDVFASLIASGSKPDLLSPEQRNKVLLFLRPYLDRGELGEKTGRGFYTYPDPAYKKPGFVFGDL
jgi:enoyl-CoA hydratase/3-hydroxyacyl-CoA dehydrogenase